MCYTQLTGRSLTTTRTRVRDPSTPPPTLSRELLILPSVSDCCFNVRHAAYWNTLNPTMSDVIDSLTVWWYNKPKTKNQNSATGARMSFANRGERGRTWLRLPRTLDTCAQLSFRPASQYQIATVRSLGLFSTIDEGRISQMAEVECLDLSTRWRRRRL